MSDRLRPTDNAARGRRCPAPVHFVPLALAALATALLAANLRAADKPPAKAQAKDKVVAIAIADVKHSGPVDFQSEVLPVLRRNCIACHNSTKAEDHLVLETPQSILKGGDSGPAVVPKHSGDSLLLQAAAHLDDPAMPPADNNVKAVALSPNELGLIKLWIDRGATGQVNVAAALIHWQKIPASVRPILAVAVSPDGELAAAGRDNEIYVYGIGSGATVARLVDPALAGRSGAGGPGVAHLDLVQSLAFQPSGDLLASGGFREVKLWRRPRNVRLATLAAAAGAINVVAVSPDGTHAATGDAAGTIRMWRLPSGTPLQTFSGHTAAITGLAFSSDGNTLFSSSLDKSIRAWKSADRTAIGKLDTPSAVNAMVLARGGTRICAGGADNIVRVWDVAAILPVQLAKPRASVKPLKELKSLAPRPSPLAPNPQANAKPLKELKGHSGPITALTTWGDGSQILSGSADGTVRGWNLDSGQQTRQVSHGLAVIAIAMRADGKRFASCGTDNIVRLWNGESNQKIAELHGDFRQQWEVGRLSRLADIAHSRVDQAKRAVADAETSAKQETDGIQKAKDRRKFAEKELAGKTAAAKHPLEAKAAAARKRAAESLAAAERGIVLAEQSAQKAADAVRVAKKAVATAEAAAKVADAAFQSAFQSTVQSAAKTAADGKPIRCLAFSPNGLFLALAGDSGLLQTVSADNGAPGDTFEGAAGAVLSLAYTPSAGLLAGSADRSAILWNTEPAWPLVRTLGSTDDPSKFINRVISLDFSPDGRLLATGGGYPSRSGELKIWNPTDGTLVRAVPDAHSDTICAVRFSPDGKLLATGAADRTMRVFNVASGSLMKTFEGHTHHVLGVAWRADGEQLATSGADTVIKVWDYASGEQRRTIEGFSKELTAIAYVASSPRVLVSSGDHYLRMVNTENGNQERTYGGATDFLYSLGVTPDGKLVAAGGQDGVLRIWNVENGQIVRSFER